MGEITPDAMVNEELVPTSTDLVQLFIRKQIELWGFESVQTMFDNGFEPMVVNGKVIWVK